MKYALVFASVISGFVLATLPAGFAAAQTVSTPYWCGNYYSSVPCSYSGNYNSNYNYNNNYNYGYNYTYPQYTYQYPASSYSNSYYPNTYYNNYIYPRPTCSISVSAPANSGYGYGNVVLSWSASNATSAYISGIGSVSTYGSMSVGAQGNTTYTMTVYGPSGTNGTCQTSYYQPVQYYQPTQYYYQYQYQQPQYYYNSYPYMYSPYQYNYSW